MYVIRMLETRFVSYVLIISIIELQPCWGTALKGFSRRDKHQYLFLKSGTNSTSPFGQSFKLLGCKQNNTGCQDVRVVINIDTMIQANPIYIRGSVFEFLFIPSHRLTIGIVLFTSP